MKKILFMIMLSVMLVSCGAYKALDVNKLSTGMTKQEVEYIIGPPERILAVNDKKEGMQEVLEYRTSGDEVYALEFWNDYLTGYEFLYDDVRYTPSLYPPTIWPDYGRPIYIIQGNRPNRPTPPNRPNPPHRPEINRPNMTKPTPGVGPSHRPSYSSNTGHTSSRPTINRSAMAR